MIVAKIDKIIFIKNDKEQTVHFREIINRFEIDCLDGDFLKLIPWVIAEDVDQAVSMLKKILQDRMLFESPYEHCTKYVKFTILTTPIENNMFEVEYKLENFGLSDLNEEYSYDGDCN